MRRIKALPSLNHKNRFIILTAILSTILMISSLLAVTPVVRAQAQEDKTVAFVDVNVIPMDTERVLEGQTVIVQNGLIQEIGPKEEVKIPENAEIIEGNGNYLMPGLGDMHYHAHGRTEALTLAVAHGVTTIRNLNAIPPELEMARQIEAGELFGPSMYNGPTIGGLPPTFRPPVLIIYQLLVVILSGLVVFGLVWAGLRFSGKGEQARKMRRIRIILPYIGLITLVAFIASSLGMLSGPVSDPVVQMIAGDEATVSPVRAEQIVRQAKADGFDFIKVNQFLRRDVFDVIVATAKEEGLPVTGHVSGNVGLEYHLLSGANVEHISEIAPFLSRETLYDHPIQQRFDFLEADANIGRVIELLKENDLAITPTINLFYYVNQHLTTEDFNRLMERPAVQYMPPEITESWVDPERNVILRAAGAGLWDRDYAERYMAVERRMLKELFDGGVTIIAGTDVLSEAPGQVWGESFLQELEMWIGAGVTPYQALAAATRVPAEFMGDGDKWGTIEVGKRADMVLFPNNPLEDISNIRTRVGVMLRGEWYSQAELLQMLG